MKDIAPQVFAAVYVADPAVGGLIANFEGAHVEAFVIPSSQWPKAWIPSWVPHPDQVVYLVLVKHLHEATVIAHTRFPLLEWTSGRKIAIHPGESYLGVILLLAAGLILMLGIFILLSMSIGR